jgi:hypothetical protein
MEPVDALGYDVRFASRTNKMPDRLSIGSFQEIVAAEAARAASRCRPAALFGNLKNYRGEFLIDTHTSIPPAPVCGSNSSP